MLTLAKSLIKKKIYSIISVIIAFVTILGINLNLDKDLNFYESIMCNDVKYIFEFVACIYLLSKLKFNNKRLTICCVVLAVIFSLFHVIGYSINNYMQLIGVYSNFHNVIKSVLSFIAYFVIIYMGCYFLFKNVSNINFREDNKFIEKIKGISNIKFYFCILALIFCTYIPYLLNYYPGIMTYDSTYQMQQGIGMDELTTHHPLVHTMLIKVCVKIGIFINGTYELGAGIYSVLQMLSMACVFAFSLLYMKKKNINIYVILISLLYFMFYPVFGMYSITMWKDIPFAVSFTLFVICIYEIITNKDVFMISKKSNLFFCITMLLIMFFRNNGFYVLILTIPFIYIITKKYYKRLTVLFIIVILIYKIVNGPLLEIFDIKKGSIKEALSVPLQQLARVEVNKKDELTIEEYEGIHKYIMCDNIKAYYNPRLSDPIKDRLNEEYFSKNKGEFIKLWLELFVKYPKEYIESFLCNTVGYWYPETAYLVVRKDMFNFENGIIIQRQPITQIEYIELYTNFVDARNIPVITMIFSIGAAVWVTIILAMYCFYNKRYRLLIIYVPVFALWLTVLASPVHAEYRYIFGLFTTIPLLMSISLKEDTNR